MKSDFQKILHNCHNPIYDLRDYGIPLFEMGHPVLNRKAINKLTYLIIYARIEKKIILKTTIFQIHVNQQHILMCLLCLFYKKKFCGLLVSRYINFFKWQFEKCMCLHMQLYALILSVHEIIMIFYFLLEAYFFSYSHVTKFFWVKKQNWTFVFDRVRVNISNSKFFSSSEQ